MSAETAAQKETNHTHKMRLLAVARYLRGVHLDGRSKIIVSEEIASILFKGSTWKGRVIRTWAKSWMLHGSIPISAQGKHWKTASFILEEDFRAECTTYLKSVKVGDITVTDFRHHINTVLLPAMAGSVGKGVSEKTARKWLVILGWKSRDAKKGVYVDGHARPDVVEYRQKQYLPTIFEYKKFMPTYVGKDAEERKPKLEVWEKEHILVSHDESIFHANDGRKIIWIEDGRQVLRPKGQGRCLMVSAFVTERYGELRGLNGEHSRVIIHPGKGYDGWWTGQDVVNQMDKTITIFEERFPGCVAVFQFDNSTNHAAFAENTLIVSKMNKGPGGKQSKLRDGYWDDGWHSQCSFHWTTLTLSSRVFQRGSSKS